MKTAIDSLRDVIVDIHARFPRPDEIKKVVAGRELIEELRNLTPAMSGPFDVPNTFCGIPVEELPEAFPDGAKVMGAIVYADPDKFPKLITRT